jgi:hypothetical protein
MTKEGGPPVEGCLKGEFVFRVGTWRDRGYSTSDQSVFCGSLDSTKTKGFSRTGVEEQQATA